MKSTRILTGSMVLLIAVSACSPAADKQTTTAPKEAAGATASSEVQHGKSEGKITAIDTAKGTVTLDHGEIPELQWPPMAMGFEASADLLKGLKVGDRVAFELDWNGATGRITRIEALPAS